VEYPIPPDGIIRLAYIPPVPNIEQNEVLGIGKMAFKVNICNLERTII
jgi:hypothetical protein